jgi:hypothetical protein
MRLISIISIILTFLSLIIVRVDLSYHNIYNGKVYDLKDEYYLFYQTSIKLEACDIICPTQRGYPFEILEYPFLHQDTFIIEKNIFYNFLFYFIIIFIINFGYYFLSLNLKNK